MATTRDMVQERSPDYGSPVTTFAWIDNAMRSWLALSPRELLPGEEHAMRQILMKLVRMRFSPENPDHILDIKGYADCWEAILFPLKGDVSDDDLFELLR